MFLRQKIQQIMLSKRSKAVCSRQGLLNEANSLTPPPAVYCFSPKSPNQTDSEAAMSPTSILDPKSFTASRNPLLAHNNAPTFAKSRRDHTRRKAQKTVESDAVGLALVDALAKDKFVVFGSELGVQIPQFSPVEFGINTKNSMLTSCSPPSSCFDNFLGNSPRDFVGVLSTSEMELSEDYTRVTAHGPNPRTTHIFDNYIVECCGGDVVVNSVNLESCSSVNTVCAADNFLSSCYACKKNLGQGEDIFMYRGEKAFCSQECRYKEMLFDEKCC